MCWNAPVSISTYLIGLAGSFWLHRRGYRIEALFYGWVVHMQLIEFALWLSLPCSTTLRTSFNILVSRLGLLINHAEPMVLWYAITRYHERTLPRWLHGLMVVFVIATILYSQLAWSNLTQCTDVSELSRPHLDWSWNREQCCRPYYLFFLGCFVLLAVSGLKAEHGRLQAVLMILSYSLSYYIYHDYYTVGEMWCFMAAFLPWITGFAYSTNPII